MAARTAGARDGKVVPKESGGAQRRRLQKRHNILVARAAMPAAGLTDRLHGAKNGSAVAAFPVCPSPRKKQDHSVTTGQPALRLSGALRGPPV